MRGFQITSLAPERQVPHVGSYVCPDGWGNRSFAGQALIPSQWDQAQFRLLTGRPVIESLAVNVEITGKTVDCSGAGSAIYARCKITFVGDGEPDRVARGWIRL
jgi:hypothetical protein